MTKECVVFVTVDGRAQAEALALTLVQERLAACVNLVGPVLSIYRFRGAVERGDEVLCVMKTTRARFSALKARVVALHTYEVPEVIALPILAGHAPYLSWLRESVVSPPSAPVAKKRGGAARRPRA